MPFDTIEKDPDPSGPGLFDGDGNINTIQWNNLIDILLNASSDKLPNFYPLQTADDIDPFTAIGGTTSQILRTYNGKGMMIVTVYGDGDADVEIHYIIDGGTDSVFTTSDQRLLAPLVFNVSLEIIAKNTALTSKTMSTVSSQGTFQ